jgi:tRNA threonylcarbamoyladenosine biosynthesis protein TsaE
MTISIETELGRKTMDYEFVSNSVEETIEIGRQIGTQLKGGEVFGFTGPLGSGKTYLIKGIAAGAGAGDNAETVSSPTFVLVNEYAGRLDIYHMDAYRMNNLSEFEMIGFDDFCYAESVVLIEWADKVREALKAISYVRIELAHDGQKRRIIRIFNMPEYIVLSM